MTIEQLPDKLPAKASSLVEAAVFAKHVGAIDALDAYNRILLREFGFFVAFPKATKVTGGSDNASA